MKKSLYDKMLNGKLKPLLIQLAIPTVISMLITSIYNMADTYFVSMIDTDNGATAAISVVFALQSLIQAIGFTLGMGCGASISRFLGLKDKDNANIYASSTLFLAFIFGTLFMIFGSIFKGDLVYLLGALPTSAPYAVEYTKYILFGTPILMMSFVMNNILRSEGHSNLSVIGLGTGGIINIGLDALFILVFNMGIGGAGLATMLSQVISFIILLSMFIFKRSETHLSFKLIKFEFKLYGNVLKLGSPTLFRQGFSSISSIVLNFLCHPFGNACVSALGITTKVYMFIRSIIIGIGQGYQPVLGYNYGAKKNDRIKEAFYFTLLLDTIICVVATLLVGFFPEFIVKFFRQDPEVVRIGTIAVRFLVISLPFLGFSTIVNQSLQVTGYSKSASFLASLRQGIVFIPVIFLLTYTLGETGICLAQPLSDLITAIISIPFYFYFFKELKKNVIA